MFSASKDRGRSGKKPKSGAFHPLRRWPKREVSSSPTRYFSSRRTANTKDLRIFHFSHTFPAVIDASILAQGEQDLRTALLEPRTFKYLEPRLRDLATPTTLSEILFRQKDPIQLRPGADCKSLRLPMLGAISPPNGLKKTSGPSRTDTAARGESRACYRAMRTIRGLI